MALLKLRVAYTDNIASRHRLKPPAFWEPSDLIAAFFSILKLESFVFGAAVVVIVSSCTESKTSALMITLPYWLQKMQNVIVTINLD